MGMPESIEVLSDDTILLGAFMNAYLGNSTYKTLVKLNSNGTINSNFATTLNNLKGGAKALCEQPDNKIIVAGSTNIPNRMVRLYASGTSDTY